MWTSWLSQILPASPISVLMVKCPVGLSAKRTIPRNSSFGQTPLVASDYGGKAQTLPCCSWSFNVDDGPLLWCNFLLLTSAIGKYQLLHSFWTILFPTQFSPFLLSLFDLWFLLHIPLVDRFVELPNDLPVSALFLDFIRNATCCTEISPENFCFQPWRSGWKQSSERAKNK